MIKFTYQISKKKISNPQIINYIEIQEYDKINKFNY